MSDRPTLYVLDGSYYVFRAFYAIRNMSNSKGMPTNGLYAFTSMLLNVIRDEAPEYLAVAFDPPGPTFRREIYAEYKANREEPPDDLRTQMPYFREIVKALRIPILETPGLEADDMIGSLAKHEIREDVNIVILSGDKDLCQLLDERTIMIDSMRGKTMGVAEVIEKYQVGPEAIADVLGLAGDSSDNIPGVPGIGIKTAGKLLKEFGSVENLLDNIDKVSGKKRKENLEAFREQALLSKKLATIKIDADLGVSLKDLELEAPDFGAFESLCAEFEFHRFPGQLREMFSEEAQAELFSDAEDQNYRAIRTRDELEKFAQTLRENGAFAFDLETTSLNPMIAEIVGLSASCKAGTAAYIPVAHVGEDTGEQLSLEIALEVFGPLLKDESLGVYVQNADYEVRVMRRYGIEIANIACDTMLAAYLIDPNKRRYNLDVLALEYLQHRTIKYADVAGKGKKQLSFDEVSVAEAIPYAAEDADITFQLAEIMLVALEEHGMLDLLRDVEIPLMRVITEMEDTGIAVDVEFLNELSVEFTERVGAIEAKIYEAAGEEFTINSPKQLSVILFEKLGLPVIKKTKTGYSTAQDVLEELMDQHELPALILEYRHLSKLKSTYVDSLPELVGEDGRVHSSFNQAVAATGRLSSSDPNLQNIPIRSEEGRRIREAFVAEEGWMLCGGDYSQIELRILAHMSQDEVLLRAFKSGEDIHRRTASEIFDVDPDAVTGDQRAAAKAINFGLIYGMGAHRLAAQLGISRSDASDYIERYFERLSGVQPFLESLKADAAGVGYAETMIGRRRPIPELSSGRGHLQALGERLAMNTPIQGSAADIIKMAMISIQKRLKREGLRGRLIVQVHDELLFEAPEDEIDIVMNLAKEEMEGAVTLDVPLTVEFHKGRSWAELKG